MINALLIGNNYDYLKKVKYNITEKILNIKYCSIATNIDELLYKIKNQKIDIILLDFNTPEISKIIKIFSDNYNNYLSSIILIYNKKYIIDNIINKEIFYSYINKNTNLNDIIKEISVLTNLKIKSIKIKEKIEDELQYLGYNITYIGTQYLIDIIYLLYNYNITYTIKLEKDIYPIIGKKYNQSGHNVKCNILNATNIMYDNSNENKIHKYFNISFKPGPKKIIFTIK